MSDKSVFLHLENVCSRRRLEIEKIKVFLDKNDIQLVDEPQKANDILLFGCEGDADEELYQKLLN